MGSSGVTVATVPLRHEAEMVKAHLEASGLDPWLVDEGIVGANPLLANAVGWIKVQVPEEQQARAREVMEALEQQSGEEGACLACGAKMPDTETRCGACGWSFL